MTPIADAVVGPELPISVDLARAPADLEGETRGRNAIERDHAIILVSTKIVEDRHAGILAAVKRGAYIVDRVHFEHKMVEPPRRFRLHEGERVMARIGVKEDGMNGRSRYR